MKYSEKNYANVSRHCVDPWSPRLKELARKIRYTIVQIKKVLRDVLPVSIVEGISKITTLHEQLKKTRSKYREFIKKAAAHR